MPDDIIGDFRFSSFTVGTPAYGTVGRHVASEMHALTRGMMGKLGIIGEIGSDFIQFALTQGIQLTGRERNPSSPPH